MKADRRFGLLLLCGMYSVLFVFCVEKMLEDGYEDDAHEAGCETAIVEQKASMQCRNLRNKQIVHNCSNKAVEKTVLSYNR